MVLTDEQQTDAYPVASMETANAASEKLYYTNIDETTSDKPAGYPNDTYTNPNDKVARLNGNSKKIGPAILLKVMSGDQMNIRANAYYRLNGASAGTPSNPASELLAALANSIQGATGVKFGIQQVQSSGVLGPGINDLLQRQTDQYTGSTRPKAFLNWILLDEQFKIVNSSSGFEPVGGDGEFKTFVKTGLPISQNGYLYLYTSNESPVDVFFDNLQVSHIRGPLLEETHYYPFGLAMAGISSKSAGKLENKFKFNKGSELQHQEFSDGSGLELYNTHFRQLDPQLGRWWQIDPKPNDAESPYAAMGNNPIMYNDALGDTLPRPVHVDPFAPTNWYGTAGIKASNARAEYNARVEKIDPNSPTAKQERVKLKEQARVNTPEPFKSIVETGRPMHGERAKINDPMVNNPTKTNAKVNEIAVTTGTLGKVFIVGGLVNSGINIATSSNPAAQVAIEGGAWAGALQLGSTGATIGSLGGPVGSFLGGLGGSVIGSVAGTKFSQWLIQNGTVGDDRNNGSLINGVFIPNNVLDKR